MRIISFCGKIGQLSILGCFFVCTIVIGCSDQNDIESEVLSFQASIDSILEYEILPLHTTIDDKITTNSAAGKDTFELARQRIPITKVQFLISSEYYTLDSV